MKENHDLAFGPLPSRRLGQSLGINNITTKTCSYACVYCQVGRTPQLVGNRKEFCEPEEVVRAVRKQVESVRRQGQTIDSLTFVPDGEPTLDLNLGREIDGLESLGIKIAVISNASLIHRPDVQAELRTADWVSLKVDAAWDDVWRQVNRPYGTFALDDILDGIRAFADSYAGVLMTDTMLVSGLNDSADHLRGLARLLEQIQPDTAYLSIPTRPPAEPWVEAPDEPRINRAFQILNERLDTVACLIGYEGNEFASTGDPERDVLSITAVHPMRREAVVRLLDRNDADWTLIDDLLDRGLIVETDYQGSTYYMRRLNGDHAE